MSRADRAFRPIHYLGSKLRLVDAIVETLQRVAPGKGTVCDLFSGSGVVSSALCRERRVVAVDIQEYARVLSEAIINPIKIPEGVVNEVTSGGPECGLTKELMYVSAPLAEAEAKAIRSAAEGSPVFLAELLEAGSLIRAQVEGLEVLPASARSPFEDSLQRLKEAGLASSAKTLVLRHYGGLFFGVRQSIQLDLLLTGIDGAPHEYCDVLRAAVLSTASEVVGTVGKQFAQPLQPWGRGGKVKPYLWQRVLKDRSTDVIQTFRDQLQRYQERVGGNVGGMAVCSDYEDFLDSCEEPLAAIYADPPYTRDHYSRYYHVLETMCLRDNPAISKTNLNGGSAISRGVYRQDRHQSPFSIVSKAEGAFGKLFEKAKCHNTPLVLSYSGAGEERNIRPRAISFAKLVGLAQQYYSDVFVMPIEGVTHSKLTRIDLHLDAPEHAEALIICNP